MDNIIYCTPHEIINNSFLKIKDIKSIPHQRAVYQFLVGQNCSHMSQTYRLLFQEKFWIIFPEISGNPIRQLHKRILSKYTFVS